MFVGGKWTLITISLNGDQEEYHADADADADDLKRVLLETAGPSWVEKYKWFFLLIFDIQFKNILPNPTWVEELTQV